MITKEDIVKYYEYEEKILDRIYDIIDTLESNEIVSYDGPITKWEISNEQVVIDWESNWQYGGHDEGRFSFSEDFLYNQSALDEYVKEQAIEIQKKKSIEDYQNKLEYNQYLELKEKFE